MQQASASSGSSLGVRQHATIPLTQSNRNHNGVATQSKMAAESIPNQHIIIPCLYTKQVLKKRKAWTDGKAKISHSKGLYFCSLIDAEDLRSKSLESCQLQPAEVVMLKKRENFVINMENHLVELDFTQSVQYNENKQAENKSVSVTNLKLPKFVPPSTVAPPSRRDTNSEAFDTFRDRQPGAYGRPSAAYNSSASSGLGKRSLDEELDDLWGETPSNKPTQPAAGFRSQQQPKQSDAASLPEYFDTSFSAAVPTPTLNLYKSAATNTAKPLQSHASSSSLNYNNSNNPTSSHASSRASSKASSPSSSKAKVSFAHDDMLSSVYRYPAAGLSSQEGEDWGGGGGAPLVSLRAPASTHSHTTNPSSTTASSSAAHHRVPMSSSHKAAHSAAAAAGSPWGTSEDDWMSQPPVARVSASASGAGHFDINAFEWE